MARKKGPKKAKDVLGLPWRWETEIPHGSADGYVAIHGRRKRDTHLILVDSGDHKRDVAIAEAVVSAVNNHASPIKSPRKAGS